MSTEDLALGLPVLARTGKLVHTLAMDLKKNGKALGRTKKPGVGLATTESPVCDGVQCLLHRKGKLRPSQKEGEGDEVRLVITEKGSIKVNSRPCRAQLSGCRKIDS